MSAGRIHDISDTIGMVYDCALDPARWPDTLAAIFANLGFRTSSLVLQELPSGRPLLDFSTGIAPEDLARMLSGPHMVEA
jgi:hypothetical protein